MIRIIRQNSTFFNFETKNRNFEVGKLPRILSDPMIISEPNSTKPTRLSSLLFRGQKSKIHQYRPIYEMSRIP